MCRRNCNLGLVLISIGATLLISLIMPRCFWVALVGAMLIVAGYCLVQK